ncbi:MAG: hypothetical protein WDA60_14750 [Acidimicrobiia bacterium]|jgi:hypothetical protein
MKKSVKSTTKKVLATVTAAGVLTLGGASVAYAADGSAGAGGAAATARAGRPHAFRAALKTAFTAAADTLGMTPQELRDAVKTGPQSIASVAGDQTGAVVDAVTAALNQKLDEAVANGTVSAERADTARERIPQAVERFVNRVPGSHAG